ncbi:hypothetical protein SmJEL517_g05226 [Synchytrium microbalum]|uniref:RNA helicase n=1 Tax=Synchytrium microbalum TaxID=1806994 RepID=A0A507BX18_9FUNG|nr:uncharacterized protein SmJEL517_g05226 [Synchytrium microbalum]TPX31409.1 hypothetical protein SmJEL517_g05226 [Synchytrium microbalum]
MEEQPIGHDGDENTMTMNADANRAAEGAESHAWAAKQMAWEEGVDNEELEQQLYSSLQVQSGINFAEYAIIDVRVKGDDIPDKIDEFSQMKMDKLMLENIQRCKYDKPTPIQKYALPIINERRDLVACAQTGSGKTAGFLIPIINKMLLKGQKKMGAGCIITPGMRYSTAAPVALVVVPTRELAIQIFNEARKFAYKTWVRPRAIYGGANSKTLKEELASGCDLLVATTGKLKDFLSKDVVRLTKVKFLVIDEADRMLELGFQEDLEEIVLRSGMPRDDLTTAMFSATWPKEIRSLTAQFLIDPLAVTVGAVGRVPTDIDQVVMLVEDVDKRNELLNLFTEEMDGLALIFVATKMGADSLDDWLYKQDIPVTSIHSGRTMEERENAMKAFRQNKTPIMIATDIAARGLDIPNVTRVINFDMPKTIDEYIHRIGRTARVGNRGTAISFYNDGDVEIAHDLAKLLKSCGQAHPEFLPQIEEGDDSKLQEDLALEDLKQSEEVGASGNGGADAGGGWGSNAGGGGRWGNAGSEANGEASTGGGDSWGGGGNTATPAASSGGGWGQSTGAAAPPSSW